MTDQEHARMAELIEKDIRLQTRVWELEGAMREIVYECAFNPELLDSYNIDRKAPRSDWRQSESPRNDN